MIAVIVIQQVVGEERELASVDQVADYKFSGKIVTVKTKEA